MALTLRENICKARKLPRDETLFMARAELLWPEDRELLEAIIIRGQTVDSVSHMMGISSRQVGNRVRKLARRLSSRKFLEAARSLQYLSQEDATLARLHFCAGISERGLAQRLNTTQYAIRRRMDWIRAQIETIRRMRHPMKNERFVLPSLDGNTGSFRVARRRKRRKEAVSENS